jgi:hypothetical protein
MRPPRAVPDPHVLIAAAIAPRGVCGQLLEAAIDDRWQPVVSPQLLDAYFIREGTIPTIGPGADHHAAVVLAGCRRVLASYGNCRRIAYIASPFPVAATPPQRAGRRGHARRRLRHPLPEGLAAAEHICFYPDKVEVQVEGNRIHE